MGFFGFNLRKADFSFCNFFFWAFGRFHFFFTFVLLFFDSLLLSPPHLFTMSQVKLTMEQKKGLHIVVVGGGNAAHCFIGMLRAQKKEPIASLKLFTTLPKEEEAWSKSPALSMKLPNGEMLENIHLDGVVPIANPHDGLHKADLVLVCVPSFAVDTILTTICPHIREGAIVFAMPGNGGFMRCARAHVGENPVTIVGTQQLPIQARLLEYATSCHLLGRKHGIQFAAEIAGKPADDEELTSLEYVLERLFEPVTFHKLKGGPDEVDLYPSNQCIHIPRLFGLWKNQPYDENPLFYEGYQEEEIAFMEEMSQELLKVSTHLGAPFPSMKDVMLRYYSHSIKDKSTLQTCFTTNEGYAGLRSPMKKRDDGKWVIDTSSRYFVEDIPYSLLIGKAIAQKAGLETPVMDRIILWAEELLGVKYFKKGTRELDGSSVDVGKSLVRYYL